MLRNAILGRPNICYVTLYEVTLFTVRPPAIKHIHVNKICSCLFLGPVINEDRLLYFHSLASLRESWVPTSALRNPELVNETNQLQLRLMFNLSDEFREGQCSLEVITPDGIMIYNDLLNNALYCWNTATEPIRTNTQIILRVRIKLFI